MKNLYLLFIGIFLTSAISAQEDSGKKRNLEIGLNITNTLAGFFNSGGTNLPTDPFLLSLKKSNEFGAIRFGTNFRVTKGREFLNNGTRELSENDFSFGQATNGAARLINDLPFITEWMAWWNLKMSN